MTVRRWTLSILVALLVLTVAAAGVFASRQNANSSAPAQQQPTGAYRFNYSVKFVCGLQAPVVEQPGTPARGEPVVKPGNYATDINIHNYTYREVPLRKKVIYLVEPTADGKDSKVLREPESARPRAFDKITLGPDWATMDDCNRLWQLLYPQQPPPVPFPLMVGYLVIISPVDIDVDAVYTAAAPGPVSRESQSVSIDVERVPGKRVFVPAGALPD